MSNELAIFEAALPSYIQELGVDDVTKALMGGGGSYKRISIRGSVWRMLVNGKEIAKNEDRGLNVVIVNASPKVARVFYAKAWAEGAEPEAPDCWSADGETPNEKAAAPQAKRCVDCPQNVKGSGQGDSRACRFSQRLAVVLANDIKGDVFQLTVPATSLFGEGAPGKWPLQTYANMLGGKGIPISAVVTEMRFDTDSSTPKITFKPVRVLEKNEMVDALEQGKTKHAIEAITMTVAEVDNLKPKAAPALQAPKEVGEVEAPESPKEPTKRAVKKETVAQPKADVASILDEWDDDDN